MVKNIVLDGTGRNIRLGYVVVVCNNMFFWYAPWLLFMLNYVSFGQVAVIQAIGLATRIVAEVPSGAVSDLLGKKKALFLAFLFTSTGEALFIIRPSYEMFVISFVITNLGYSFYSGTIDAFFYDTLLGGKRESEYPRLLSRQQALTSGAVATASMLGGLAYHYWMILPWLLTVAAKVIGVLVVLRMDEPVVDTYTFSWGNFAQQTKRGFSQLLAKSMLPVTAALLTYGMFSTISYELFDDLSVVAFGYDAVGIGILYSVLIFLTVPFSFLYQFVEKRISTIWLVFGGIGVLALNYIFSPWIGVVLWTGLFLLRVIYSPIKDAAITQIINTSTPSNIRATTISTYELIRKIPYLFLAGSLGVWLDLYGVKQLAFWYAGILLLMTIPQLGYWAVFGIMKGRKGH